jgi:hypothetical protein
MKAQLKQAVLSPRTLQYGDAFNETQYASIGLDELIAFGVNRLAEMSIETTFENIVAVCFTLFPKRFELRGYPQWPDAHVIGKSVWRARTDKGYLSGSVRQGYRITPKGLKMLEVIDERLHPGRPFQQQDRLSEARTRAGRVLRHVQQSEAFRQYQISKAVDHISDYDFADLLLCPPDAPAESLQKSFDYFVQSASLYGRKDLLEFMEVVGRKFAHILHGNQKKRGKTK